MQNEKLRFWEEPQEKAWWSFIVDGRVLGVVQESAMVERERKRLSGLCGIEVVRATFEELQNVRACTQLPKRITLRMRQLYIKSLRKSEGK